MKKVIIFLLFTPGLVLEAQHLLKDDTIKINEVLVRSTFPEGRAGYRKSVFNIQEKQDFPGLNLSDFLSGNTSLYIKDYGGGGLKSVSFRGLGPAHTSVLWEGIRIDNPMLGQSDFALLPFDFVDNISVYYGGNPSSFGNRGSGGSVELSTSPFWNKRTELVLSVGGLPVAFHLGGCRLTNVNICKPLPVGRFDFLIIAHGFPPDSCPPSGPSC